MGGSDRRPRGSVPDSGKRAPPSRVRRAPLPPPVRMARQTAATRSLLEVALGFLGVVLVVPLLFKVVFGTLRGILRLGTTRRLIGDIVVAGLTALLTREDVLDTLFGKKGTRGDGLLKPDARK